VCMICAALDEVTGGNKPVSCDVGVSHSSAAKNLALLRCEAEL
jgi:hypothetical protein